MPSFPIHTADTAPEGTREVLEKAKGRYGFVPNLIGALSESPEAAEHYMALGDALRKTTLTTEELHVVWFTVNRLHECGYCMAAHSAIAKGDKVSETVIETARVGGTYADARLEALRVFTEAMVIDRGWVAPEVVDAFLAAGFTRKNVFEVILVISHKVLSNYTNHIVGTPVDAPFQPFAWEPVQIAAE
ncbi:MAG: carboxymuconolactone decarboxylase family protein [Pseudomonadota bacterium]